jgi:hypothetical protein
VGTLRPDQGDLEALFRLYDQLHLHQQCAVEKQVRRCVRADAAMADVRLLKNGKLSAREVDHDVLR